MNKPYPSEWNSFCLRDVVESRSSNVDKKSYDGDKIVQLCNYTDVYYNNRITSSISFMIATAKDKEIERFSLCLDDVIITKDSETPDDIAIPAYVSEELDNVVCGYHLTLLRPYKNKASGEYLAHLFRLPIIQHYFYILANGITRFGLTADAIANAPLVLPPLPEQQKIAKILTSVDEVIEKTQAQTDKLKDLKTGMMQELLTKGVGVDGKPHTEFKDSPVGRIPKGWEVRQFGEIFKSYKYGPRFSAKDYALNGNVKTIRGTDLSSNGVIKYTQVPTAKLDEKLVDQNALEDGDLVMITTADCGATAVFEKQSIPYIASAYAIKLTPKAQLNSKYINYFMQTRSALTQVESFIRKGTVANLPGSDVMSIVLALPSLNEQNKIVDILEQLDKEIALKSDSLESKSRLKKALMQDLLTGKVRVQVD
ncbi:restriction endonuclease subunit S [Vibrio salinus]|uniref:restriction endonuclease subunit S n=1 Tax=Vibrio salinus TaxID=2899784 RepID=UPI001E434F3F|nr:restriction endonuclease subunit S [Vibrio salinus]MCE0493121.1 restriction endonuclease subunit S [Vibrio salinus]